MMNKSSIPYEELVELLYHHYGYRGIELFTDRNIIDRQFFENYYDPNFQPDFFIVLRERNESLEESLIRLGDEVERERRNYQKWFSERFPN